MINSPERNATTNPSAARIQVRWLPIEALRPDERNARVHSARQVARIADSIKAFGFNVPILVDGKGSVLAGHGRLLAARRLGLKEVPTITLDHLGEAERRAFMIADNRLAQLARWDDRRLGAELIDLRSRDLEFAIEATGFEMNEIEFRIEPRPQPDKDRAALGRKGPTVAREGDMWTLGSSRLICGDGVDALSALDAAIERWQAVTGERASLHPSGQTFARIAQARRAQKA